MRTVLLVFLALALGVTALPLCAQEFPDVPAGHWAYQAVMELVDAGIMQGYPDGTFSGKRALTRYEFAEAIVKAISVIEERALASDCSPNVPPVGPQVTDPRNLVTKEQLRPLRLLVDEFRDELGALGLDVDNVRRDLAALSARAETVEREVARVRFSGTADIVGRGEVRNSASSAFDIDNRPLSADATPANRGNPLANSIALSNLAFGMKARAGETASLNAVIDAGNYMDYALNPDGELSDFLLWNLYADAPVSLGSFGSAQLVAGRYPLQLTPFTLRFVDPDSYAYVPLLDSYDYLLDGGRATFSVGNSSVTAFGAKSADLGNGVETLMRPNLQISGGPDGLEVGQIGGVRAVIGTPIAGNLGLTWYEAGLAPFLGRAVIYGADIQTPISPKMGISGEYARMDANDELKSSFAGLEENNFAWNAKLSYNAGRLGLGAGYVLVKENYAAPGYWLRTGRAVNLRNVRGALASASYSFNDKLSVSAEGQFLQPDQGNTVVGRTAVERGETVDASSLDKVTYWRAGVKYGINAVNAIRLDWEQGDWSSTTAGAEATRERYITVGLEHSVNPNAYLRFLYQIADYRAGDVDPYQQDGDSRGGVATAQFELKY